MHDRQPASETKSHRSQQTKERQPQGTKAPEDTLITQQDPLTQVISPMSNVPFPSAHATRLNRLTASSPSLTQGTLLQLQRQYGNRYVQRVMNIARQGQGNAEVAPEVEAAIQRKRRGGQALDSTVQVQMESAFGTDFGGVRVHADGEADGLNRALSARAFTTGQDIFFRQGEYAPGSSRGKELLAHELTHVVQQRDGMQYKLAVGQPGDRYEQEADRVAKKVMEMSPSLLQKQSPSEEEEEESVQIPQSQTPKEEEEKIVQTKIINQPASQEERRFFEPCAATISHSTGEPMVQGDFWDSIRRGAEMYWGVNDEGSPLARSLMRWRIIGMGRDYVEPIEWSSFMVDRPEIQRAMATKFNQLALGFAASGGSGSFTDSITGVSLNELESMRLTLHGCHRIDIEGDYEVIDEGSDKVVRFRNVHFIWVDRADLHPGTVTELETGEEVDDREFTSAGWDYDIYIHFYMPRTSTWRVSGGRAEHERGWPPVTGAPAAGFRG